MSEQKFDFQNIDLKLYLALRNICKDYLSLCEDAGGVMDSPPKEYVDAQLALAEFELSHGPLPNWAIARNWDYSLVAAAPAQGQQVEWRTTAVMLEQANAGLAQLNGKLRAELSALKAQQVGQEPVAWRVTGAGGLTVTPEYPKWAEDDSRLLIESLYTAPQPAPAQDVAGWIPVTERLPEVETDVLVRGVRRNEVMHRVAGLFNGEWSSQETEDLLLGEVTHWMPLPAAPAAHDKQSGVE